MEATKDKLHRFIDDGIHQMLEEKLVMLTNLLLERGISLTSQEKNCIVDLDYDASRYASQSSTHSDESDESDNEDTDEDDDDDASMDSDENEDDDSKSVSHNFDRLVVCNEDGKFSLDMDIYRERLYKLGRCHICGSCDHTGFRDEDEHDIFCPNKKAFVRYRLEEAAKL